MNKRGVVMLRRIAGSKEGSEFVAAPHAKFNNVHTAYGGFLYHSAKEARYAARLDHLRLAGQVVSWRRQVPIPVVLGRVRICTYIADFEVTLPGGAVEIHEVKGVETPVWRLKCKLVRALYPDLVLKVIR